MCPDYDTDVSDEMAETVETVSEMLEGRDVAVAFGACATVALDVLSSMLESQDEESTKVALLLANEFHAEFLGMMQEFGYDLQPVSLN